MNPVVSLTQSLVRIPSVNPVQDPASPGTPRMIQAVADWGGERGFEVERLPVAGGLENLVLRLVNGEGKHLLLNGHLDTVSTKGMTIEPFGAEIRDGKLFGRGTCDMKGPVACMLMAADWLREHPEAWQGTLTLGFTPDEEVATAGIRTLITQIPRPDAAIVGEPTALQAVRGCKGGIRFAIHCHGLAAHSSRPERGRSAIVAMSRAIVELDRYFADVLGNVRLPQFGPSTGSIGLIEGGTAVNIVPDLCSIRIDIRLIPGQDPDRTLSDLETWFRGRFPDENGIRWSIEVLHLDPPYEIAPEHPWTKMVCEVTGTQEPDVAFFCCDASKLAAAGIPCVILGPGDIAQAHTIDEFIDLAQLEAGVEIYRELACRALARE